MAVSNLGLLIRRFVTLAAVATAGFLAGWSAVDATAGIVFAIALTAGAAVAVFRSEPHACITGSRRGRRHRH